MLEAYREKLPRKRKSNVQLRSVAGSAETANAAESSALVVVDEYVDGTGAFKDQFPGGLKEPPSAAVLAAAERAAAAAAAAALEPLAAAPVAVPAAPAAPAAAVPAAPQGVSTHAITATRLFPGMCEGLLVIAGAVRGENGGGGGEEIRRTL